MLGLIVLSCLFVAVRPDAPCCTTSSSIYAALGPIYRQLQIIEDQISGQLKKCCSEEVALGMEDGSIPDSSLSASTSYTRKDHGPDRARPETQGYAGAWCAGANDTAPWIQVDFEKSVKITGVMTQGRSDTFDESGHEQWVTKYHVVYSQDGNSWVNVADDSGPITFSGNSDRNTHVTHTFPNVVYARYLRIEPIKWHDHCSLRFEVYGCRGQVQGI